MNKKTKVVIALLVLAVAVLITGWVLPRIPVVRHMSEQKARTLFSELSDIHLKDMAGQASVSDLSRKIVLRDRLNRAGYYVNSRLDGSLYIDTPSYWPM